MMNQSKNNNVSSDSHVIQLKPVGIIRNQSKDPSCGGILSKLNWRDRATRMKEQRESVSELTIDASLDGILGASYPSRETLSDKGTPHRQ
jgi:hypothetical protein